MKNTRFEYGQQEKQRYVNIIGGIFLSITMLFVSRLFFLQIMQGSDFKAKAFRVSQRVTIIPAKRGEIYDRSFTTPLVLNVDSFAVSLIPAEVKSATREAVFQHLADILGISVDIVHKKIPKSYYHLYQPIEVKDQVPYDTIVQIAEHIDEYPGVTWHDKPQRHYVDVNSLSHILGYVGDITREELQIFYNQGYESGTIIGKTGVEKQYDKLLRGKEGRKYTTVDVKGKSVISQETIALEEPEPGKDLVLTIDRNLQTLCEKALGQRSGAVVVLRPQTGEILAMVSYPWYDPNKFSGINGNSEYVKLLKDPQTPLLNRAVQSSYPPASTFKTIMSTGIIEDKLFPLDKTIECKGEISYGERIHRCWIRKPGHGALNLKGALANSCDVYYWTVAKDVIGIERIIEYAKEFQLGKASGIDLPGESDGFIPNPQWKERRYHEKWLGGDTLNTSIGQGYMLVSPIQLADQLAMIFNSGKIYKPHVLKEVRETSSGAILKRVEPELLHQSSISQATFQKVKEHMRAVITEGTAKLMNFPDIKIAGKTGTGEIGQADHWHSWFGAFTPYDNPNDPNAIVVSVIVEASNTWEWWGTYAAAIILYGASTHKSYEETMAVFSTRGNLSQATRERRE